jgi:hypothetical protein
VPSGSPALKPAARALPLTWRPPPKTKTPAMGSPSASRVISMTDGASRSAGVGALDVGECAGNTGVLEDRHGDDQWRGVDAIAEDLAGGGTPHDDGAW